MDSVSRVTLSIQNRFATLTFMPINKLINQNIPPVHPSATLPNISHLSLSIRFEYNYIYGFDMEAEIITTFTYVFLFIPQMKTPAIQNDFSYYRRIVSRQRIDNTSEMVVTTELANRMSLFYAHATPMLKVLSEATSKFVTDNTNDVENTTETLGTMAKVCLRMLENP